MSSSDELSWDATRHVRETCLCIRVQRAARALARHFDDALRDFSKTLSIDPKYANALFNRGQIYADRKDFERAIPDLTAALKLKPDDADYKDGLAQALKDRKSKR